MHTTAYLDIGFGQIVAHYEGVTDTLVLRQVDGYVLSLTIYGAHMEPRLRLAAAALNGDWAELRRLLDAVAPDREAVAKKEPTP